jgi:transposase InsO family protein
LGGTGFKVDSRISKNQIALRTNALADTGANGAVFCNTKKAYEAIKYCNATTKRLREPIPVVDYAGRPGKEITHGISLDLELDGVIYPNTFMFITDCGKHDLLVGFQFLAQHGILLDPANKRLIQQVQEGPISFGRTITVQPPRAEDQTAHQHDADRRDALMNQHLHKAQIKILQRASPPPSPPPRPWKRPQIYQTHDSNLRDSYNMMRRELEGDGDDEAPKDPGPDEQSEPTRGRNWQKPPILNIALVNAAAFHHNLRQPGSQSGAFTLAALDAMIMKKHLEEHPLDDEQTLKLIQGKLPAEYAAFTDVFSKSASDELPPFRTGVDHKIHLTEPESKLTCNHLYKLSEQELQAARKYIMENLDKGFIAPSKNNPFAFPILFDKKPDGSLRFCVDYRRLNEITRKDPYPIPLIDEILPRLLEAKVMTKIDIRQAFHRIRIDPESEHLTTFRTRYGSFHYKVMPFGLTNGPATFQRYMNDLFIDMLDDFITIYLDDILIYSKDRKEHTEHVKKVLQRLREAGLQADIRKCEFSVTKTKYLGFIVSTEGLQVDPEKIQTIANWVAPTTIKGLQSFLGFCNFYRRFIEGYSRITKPLHQLTRKDIPYDFNAKCQEAFQKLKQALISAPILRHWNPESPTKIETDSSDGVTSGILSQQQPDDQLWHPVAYFSKTMSPTECNYEIHDKEMLAIIRTLQEWRAELVSVKNKFRIYSDHEALTYFMTKRMLNARQARWAGLIADYDFEIAHTPGHSNGKADALTRREEDVAQQEKLKKASRNRVLLKPTKLDPKIVAEINALECNAEDNHKEKNSAAEISSTPANHTAQLQSLPQPAATTAAPIPDIHLLDDLLQANRTDPGLQKWREEVGKPESPWTMNEQGLLLHKGRLVVSSQDHLRTKVIDLIHSPIDSAHPGKSKTKKLLTARYYWPGMAGEAERFIDNCLRCLPCKSRKDLPPGLLQPLSVPDRPNQHLTMDFKELPEDEEGYDYALIIVDRFCKDFEPVACRKTTTATDLCQMFHDEWITRYGIPESITSDRGPQFRSDIWKEFNRIYGTRIHLSSARHPQTDGQSERAIGWIDEKIRPYLNYKQTNWRKLLRSLAGAYQKLPNDALGGTATPFQIRYGYEPRMIFDWTKPMPPPDNPNWGAKRDTAEEAAQRQADIWTWAKSALTNSRQAMKTQADKHRREVDFDVGDYVMVSTKGWKTDRPSKKHDKLWAGPFPVIDKVGTAFRVLLPEQIKVHNVFHPEKLRKHPMNPLPGQRQDVAEPIQVNREYEYEVDKILDCRLFRKKTLQYKVSWVGWDPDDTWYPASDFKNSPYALQRYHNENPNGPPPPKRLDEWTRCYKANQTDPDHPDDDKPARTPQTRT